MVKMKTFYSPKMSFCRGFLAQYCVQLSVKFSLCCNQSYSWSRAVVVSGEGEAALGEGEEPAEGQHRGEQGEDAEAGELLDRSADPVPHRQ